MADSFLTSSQLVTINDKNAVDLGVSDLFDDAPLIKVLAAAPASNGTHHKYLKQTASSGAAFRAINAGVPNTVSTDVLVDISLQILAGSYAVDKAAADAYFKGAAEYVAREMRRKLRAVFFAAENQIVNGTVGGSASGFNGFADSLSALSSPFVVNAAGTTAATGSSIYLIRTNDVGTDVQVVYGNGGNVQVGETIVQMMTDGSGNHYPIYYTPCEGLMGLQQGSVYSVVRIANVTADSGKGATDALISSALALFPASKQPNVIAMGRRSLSQLQKSRTAFSPTGAPAEIPSQAFNIPIVVTDAITATEALLS